jgi:tRNA 2-thiouridine synthesizing protein A
MPPARTETRKALLGLRNGDQLEVVCTDPLARIDIPHLVATLGDELISQQEQDDCILFNIRRQAAKD